VSRPDYGFVAWNPLLVSFGPSVRSGVARPVPLEGQIESINECSYATRPGCIGIAGRDVATGEWILAMVDLGRGETVHRFAYERVLHHALLPDGTIACLTRPSATPMVADLDVVRVGTGEVENVLRGGVHQGSRLSWFPDGRRIAFESPDGQMRVVDRIGGGVDEVAAGGVPAVGPDGDRIAYTASRGVVVMDYPNGRVRAVETGRAAPSTGLSWSPDGRCLAWGTRSGLTGKQTRFHLHDLDSGRREDLPLAYATGLVLVDRAVGG
jgi:dipeptidyl aminopeptidase/acylaminoacyl peptidase